MGPSFIQLLETTNVMESFQKEKSQGLRQNFLKILVN